MLLLNVLLFSAMTVQFGFETPNPDFFLGKWTTASDSGPTYLVVESKSGKLFITVDRQEKPIEATLYLSAQPRRLTVPNAIVANGRDRMFVIRKQDQDIVLDMFSTFSDRPPLHWSERFVKAPK